MKNRLELLKMPPHSAEMECAILGAIIIDSRAIEKVCDILTPETFYKIENMAIYEAIQALYRDGRPIDILTVVQSLKENGKLQQGGGIHYISELTTNVASSAHIVDHAKDIHQLYLKRRTIEICHSIISEAYSEECGGYEVITNAQADFMNLELGNLTNEIHHIKDVAIMTAKEIHESIESRKKGKTSGIPTLSPTINTCTGGFLPKGLSVVAALAGGGKTAFALQCIKQQIESGYKCGVISLEMSKTQLLKRLLSNDAEINGFKIRDGDISPTDLMRLETSIQQLSKTHLYIIDDVWVSLKNMRSIIRRMVKMGVQIVYIDYLGLIRTDIKNKPEYQVNEEITRELQRIAREFEIPIVLLSQTSRLKGKKPTMEELRGGGIEQASDLILLLHSDNDEENKTVEEPLTVIIGKAKHGTTGEVNVLFNKQYQRISESSGNYYSPQVNKSDELF